VPSPWHGDNFLGAVVEPGKMKSTLSLLLVFLNHFFMPRHNAQGMRSQPVNR